MRPLASLVFAGSLVVLGLVAAPPRAHAVLDPVPPGTIGITTKILVRVLEFVDWAMEDLRAQLDRRNRWDPPPPITAPALDAVASGSSTTAAGAEALAVRRDRAGMIP